MSMKSKVLISCFITLAITFSAIGASGQDSAVDEKPALLEAVVTTLEAKVVMVDQENRKVTLKGPEGKTVTIDVDEDVKNLPQVEVGDLLTVKYIEAVTIQVLSPEDAEVGLTAVADGKSAKLGEKPAGVVVEEVNLVVTIEAIDKEQQLVTLKGAEGNSKTVKARNPENLEKVKVGDKVMISYSRALGISVTE